MKNLILSTSVIILGFLLSCTNAPKGEKATTTDAKPMAKKEMMASKTLSVQEGSMLTWTGSKVGGTHAGTINVSGGDVKVSDGAVTGGKVTIDMNSINCTDLEAGKGKEKLEGHLKSPDFFDTATNPTASFEITSVAGGNITGNLMLKGVTKSVTFPANVNVTPDGVAVTSGEFTINRTDWGIQYGSASFFDGLKDKAINDNIGLSIKLKAM